MKLLWLDLETTGLNPSTEQILEVAIRIAEFKDPFTTDPGFYATVKLEEGRVLSPFILEMHTKNKLLDECVWGTEVKTVDYTLSKMFPLNPDKEERPILAGSSIHFDHGFIAKHLPMFNANLSYRHYDVRALALYCQSVGMEKPKKAEAHRADADILESIELGRACDAWLRSRR